MKLTEQHATTITKKVLADIEFKYHTDQPIKANYTESEALLEPNTKKGWICTCKWFDPDFLGGMEASAFLIINDETGEPTLLSRRTGGMGNDVIDKDETGNYFVKSRY